jgi:hypothetical protein
MTTETERATIIAQARELDAETVNRTQDYDGPGAHEGMSEDERELCAALEVIANHGFADAQAGDVDQDGRYGSRVGPFILWIDEHGFRRVDTYPDADSAQQTLDAIDDPHFTVCLDRGQLAALDAAIATCENVWDGDDDQSIEEQANLAAARAALANAELVR